MSEIKAYPVPEAVKSRALLTGDDYQAMYQASISDPDSFWGEQAEKFLDWEQPWDKVHESDFSRGLAKWFVNGKLNVSANCIDRHQPYWSLWSCVDGI